MNAFFEDPAFKVGHSDLVPVNEVNLAAVCLIIEAFSIRFKFDSEQLQEIFKIVVSHIGNLHELINRVHQIIVFLPFLIFEFIFLSFFIKFSVFIGDIHQFC